MKISVLTVCWNSAATIRHTIDSFLAQDYGDKELVVIDGNSSDETLSIVRSYPSNHIRLVSEPDSGMYDALNKGLRLYIGDAVGVLNSDDCFHDRTVLGRISAGLETADIVHGDLDFVEDHLSKRVVRRWRAAARPAKGFRTGWMPAHPTFYVRRKVADAVGAFDLSLKVASDYDWMLRAVELHGFQTAATGHVLVDMMQGGKSTNGIRSQVGHNIEALHSRRKWLGSGAVDYALIAKPARKIGQFITAGRRP
ncbi:MAG: glycosyltransferase [Mesorhizobium sp.]|uniref:glycosyltransferase family 2 protein n=1 Tax=Mesorhizobium sp. TaxID=1871066 RepID=UPI00120CEDF5|nr:glycosyltransferase family 2 protein [Mesorhizobium sp.]TIL90074.1 MAG: glycosyltransferase [Mesorhizobium sp.]TIM01810.1 MAG: glycosyltransferase [Mesorhizobium sp.]